MMAKHTEQWYRKQSDLKDHENMLKRDLFKWGNIQNNADNYEMYCFYQEFVDEADRKLFEFREMWKEYLVDDQN